MAERKYYQQLYMSQVSLGPLLNVVGVVAVLVTQVLILVESRKRPFDSRRQFVCVCVKAPGYV